MADFISCAAAALEYAKRGFRVFPMHSLHDGACTCHLGQSQDRQSGCKHPGKHPRIRNWQALATTSPSQIEKFWSDYRKSNVGIATGKSSGIFVLDVDPKNGGEETIEALMTKHGRIDTLQAITGSCGKHFYFQHPGIIVKNTVSLLPGLDVRGDGGLVVAPPSIHLSGRTYEWDGMFEFAQTPILEAPTWLLAALNGEEAARKSSGFSLPKQITEGCRNDVLFKYACALRSAGGGLESNEILGAALAVNRSRCTPPLSEAEVCTLVESACRFPKGRAFTGLIRSKQPEVASEESDVPAEKKNRETKIRACDLAEIILKSAHFAVDAGGKLYIFENGVYRPSGERYVKGRVKAILNEMQIPQQWSSHIAEEVVQYIAVDAPTLWPSPPVETVNVLNGLLDVRTKELRSHSPQFLSPVQLPVRYDPNARCPAWDKFVSEVFPQDAEAIAWEIVAWLMTPDTSIQKAILLIGEGANGKSTYLSAVLAFIGRENASALSLHKLEKDRFAIARLIGRLANICPDLPSTDLTSTSVFKAITGGDPLMAEHKFKNTFEFVSYARLIFSANHPPKSQDASPAFFRRWVPVPFERIFDAHALDTIPRDKLDAMLSDPTELSGVLNKALDALRVLRSKRNFSECDSTRRAMDEFRQATDPLLVWLDRHTVLRSNALIPKDRLYREYSDHCSKAGRPVITKAALGRALKQLRTGVGEFQRTVNGVVTWCWVGLGLLTDEDER